MEIRWPPGIKKTKPRVQILQALSDADTPLTASDLSARLEKRGTPIWLSTIYRTLDAFAQTGVVLKTQIVDSGMAVYELIGERHRHYAVCVLCHRVVPMENCPLESFLPELTEKDFHVLGHRLQMYGYCGRCAQSLKRG